MTDGPLTLWHASRADIERPTIAGRTEGDHHANSGLGIFCATGPHDYIVNFGGDVHALVIREDARIMDLTIPELRIMGETRDGERDRAWFDAEGRRLGKDFDVIMLRETDGLSTQAVILNDEAVASSRRMDEKTFRTLSHDIDQDIRAHKEKVRREYDEVRPRGPYRMRSMAVRDRSQGR